MPQPTGRVCNRDTAPGNARLEFRDGLVDRFYWIQSPVWLGDAGVRAVAGWDAPALPDALRWTVVERRPLGVDTLLTLDREPCSPVS